MQRSYVAVAISATLAACLAVAPASAGMNVHTTVPTPGSLFASATVDACQNNPGPFVTLSGELTLAGLNGRLIFRNNRKGTHTRTEMVSVDAVLLEAGKAIQFAKQPPQGGVGGNPWIYLQLFDDSWRPISNRILLGRCVQGLSPAALRFALPTDANVNVAADGCFNRPGPLVTLSGELSFGGINGRLTFQNNRTKGVHVAEAAIDVDFVILEPGESITFAKQPPLGGVGGNPRISFQFTDGAGNPLGNEIYLGRCVQIGN